MAYSQHTWATGETITAANLNNMEGGIANAALATDVSSLQSTVNTMNTTLNTATSNISTLTSNVAVITDYNNAGTHNCLYRGKSLGSSLTSTQASSISGASFSDLYIGDYWAINSVNYRIGSFDYYYRCGDTSLTTHTALLVPDARLYTAPMNATNTTEGAYVGSAMYTCENITVSDVEYTGLVDAISTIQSAFGSYVVEHQCYLNNAASNGYPSAGAWYDNRVCDLMTENMVYGGQVMSQMSFGGTRVSNYRIEKSQLPLFMFNPTFLNIRAFYWLRDVVSSSAFALVASGGNASSSSASSVNGVRPYFLIS